MAKIGACIGIFDQTQNAMRNILICLVLWFGCHPAAFAQKVERSGLLVSFKVKSRSVTDTFPYLIANKDWNAGKVMSLESNSNYGMTLTSGVRRGWALFMQPNGALGWNLGNEKRRLDYLPTNRRKINDGRWHRIDLFYDYDGESMWLWLDGVHLTTYNMRGMEMDKTKLNGQISQSDQFKIRRLRFSENHMHKLKPPQTTDQLKIVNWNIWHGGRHNEGQKGVQQVIGHISDQAPDVICLQETYGSGPIIADALEYTFYSISSNLSIMTRFPIRELYQGYDDFRFGGVKLQVDEERSVNVFDIWINSSPSTDKHVKEKGPLGKMLGEEMQTRGREMLQIHKAIKELNIDPNEPRIMAGDFNSGSHLDWTERTASRHGGLVVPWPASRTMYREGYIDVWRTLHPDEVQQTGYTWSPRFRDELQYRIDYIYTDNLHWYYDSSEIIGYELGEDWPSDHAMVTSTLRWKTFTQTP